LSETHSRSHVLAAFAAVYVVWGSTYLAIRYAVETIPPFLMGGARFVVSGLMLYAWARMRGAPRPTKIDWRDATIAGMLMLCFGNGAVGWAEQRLSSGVAALIVAVVPLWMVLLDWARPRGTRPRATTIVGVIVGLIGLAVLVGMGEMRSTGSIDKTAALILVLGSLSWAAGSVYNKQGVRPESSAMATGTQLLGGSVVLVAFGALTGELNGFALGAVSRESWLGWLYLVTFGSLVGFTAYIYLLKAVSAAKAATYAYVNPIVAVLLGWAIAHEAVTARMIVGAAIILGAVAMITLVESGSSEA
jgi:drug/metabolite transporter (DMT)-like permease